MLNYAESELVIYFRILQDQFREWKMLCSSSNACLHKKCLLT